jgi:hypothetical protein
MDQMQNLHNQILIESLSFEEKIKLARLEEAKARERVRELEYEKARFLIEANKQLLRNGG